MGIFNSIEGVRAGLLIHILQVEAERNPSSVNLFVNHLQTIEKDGTTCYQVGFSTTFKPLSGRAYINEYVIKDGKAVYVKMVMSRMS